MMLALFPLLSFIYESLQRGTVTPYHRLVTLKMLIGIFQCQHLLNLNLDLWLVSSYTRNTCDLEPIATGCG